MSNKLKVGVLGATGRTRIQVIADIALLCCVAAVGITVVFADQTWDGVATATDWHTYFGPSIPWYHEADRYGYLLEQPAGRLVSASSIEFMLFLCAAYVFGCAFRSFLPRADVQRICLFDTWLSSVVVGRTVATVAEVCFVAQWAIILHQLGTMTGADTTVNAACPAANGSCGQELHHPFPSGNGIRSERERKNQ